MKQRTTTVKCLCGWRGRRVRGECMCYDEWALSCACAWGYCPRCQGRVWPVAYWRQWQAEAR